MSIAVYCLVAAALMPVVCAGIAKGGAPGFDNRQPRQWLAAQSGLRARANAAQSNCWEAFPIFAVGVLLALQAQADPARIDMLALIFIGLRVLYVALYLADRSSLRSLVWLLGLAVSLALYFIR